jgi:hypothetical protein
MSSRDFLVMLLHIAAEIEHGLMVQYLYAAYSLGGDQIPTGQRAMVQCWKDSILAIAKEEMGHLLTVQNVLTLLGAPVNLDRDAFPWDIPYYPFPFHLEPLTLDSLSRYIYAEMPPNLDPTTAAKKPGALQHCKAPAKDVGRIVERVLHKYHGRLHPVGAIYEAIIKGLKDEEQIPDSLFRERSVEVQATWDDWGRGYRPDPRRIETDGSLPKSKSTSSASTLAGSIRASAPRYSDADVLIETVATRSQAVAALEALSAQGEAPPQDLEDNNEPSHFARMIEIYWEFEQRGGGWRPTYSVPINPTTQPPDPTIAECEKDERGCYIEAERSRMWADLFNLRYRILLIRLKHTFSLARATGGGAPSLRTMMMRRVVAEMYNLKAIAGILVRSPLCEGDGGSTADYERAGPPFEMPYSLSLPPAELDVWQLHDDLLGTAEMLCRELEAKGGEGQAYLQTLITLDREARAWIGGVLTDLLAAEGGLQ